VFTAERSGAIQCAVVRGRRRGCQMVFAAHRRPRRPSCPRARAS